MTFLPTLRYTPLTLVESVHARRARRLAVSSSPAMRAGERAERAEARGEELDGNTRFAVNDRAEAQQLEGGSVNGMAAPGVTTQERPASD